jgi:DnaJ-class molecular chaperone
MRDEDDVPEDEECWDCRGTGIGDPHAGTPCPTCNGRGYPKAEPEERDDDDYCDDDYFDAYDP